MKKRSKRLLSLMCAAMFVMASLLGGCGSSGSDGSTGSSTNETASTGSSESSDAGEVVINYAQIATWDTLFPWSKGNY